MATCKEYVICHIFDRELRCAREILAKGMYVLISSVPISDIQTTNQVWIQDLLLCQIARILNIELVFVSNLLVRINQHKRMVHRQSADTLTPAGMVTRQMRGTKVVWFTASWRP